MAVSEREKLRENIPQNNQSFLPYLSRIVVLFGGIVFELLLKTYC